MSFTFPGYLLFSFHNGVLIPPGQILLIRIFFLVISWDNESENPQDAKSSRTNAWSEG